VAAVSAARLAGGEKWAGTPGLPLEILSQRGEAGLTDRTDLLSSVDLAGTLLLGKAPAPALPPPRKGSSMVPAGAVVNPGAGDVNPASREAAGGEEYPFPFVIGLDDTLHRRPRTRKKAFDGNQGGLGPGPADLAVDRVFQEEGLLPEPGRPPGGRDVAGTSRDLLPPAPGDPDPPFLEQALTLLAVACQLLVTGTESVDDRVHRIGLGTRA
jgi:hypothetical protein